MDPPTNKNNYNSVDQNRNFIQHNVQNNHHFIQSNQYTQNFGSYSTGQNIIEAPSYNSVITTNRAFDNTSYMRTTVVDTNCVNIKQSSSVIKNYRDLGNDQNYTNYIGTYNRSPKMVAPKPGINTNSMSQYDRRERHYGPGVIKSTNDLTGYSQQSAYNNFMTDSNYRFYQNNSAISNSKPPNNNYNINTSISGNEKSNNYFCNRLPDFSKINKSQMEHKFNKAATEMYRYSDNSSYIAPAERIIGGTNYLPFRTNSAYIQRTNYSSPHENSLMNQPAKQNVQTIPQQYSGNTQSVESKPKVPTLSTNSSSSSRPTTCKVSNTTKLDYSKMIYTLKNPMSEYDLNMKIIERALRGGGNLRTNELPYVQKSIPAKKNSIDNTQIQQQYIPLDLSKKSVKTIADSTLLPENKDLISNRGKRLFSAPKVDFIPIIMQTAEKLLYKEEQQTLPDNQELHVLNLTTNTKPKIECFSRIRTKGELKVFNPNSLNNFCNQTIHKISDLSDLQNETKSLNLFEWDKACTQFVNQLEEFNGYSKKIKPCPKNRKNIQKNNKNILKRVAYQTNRLQKLGNLSSSEEDTIDSLRDKKLELFKAWKRKRQRRYKSSNNTTINNNNNYFNCKHKIEYSPKSEYEEYKESDIAVVTKQESTEMLSSSSHKSQPPKTAAAKKTQNNISCIMTRSKALQTSKRFNLRKRIPVTSEINKKRIRKKNVISIDKKKNEKPKKRFITGKKQENCLKDIDWEDELGREKQVQIDDNFSEIKIKSENNAVEAMDSIRGCNSLENKNRKGESIEESSIEQNNSLTASNRQYNTSTNFNSSFERKYEEYLSIVCKNPNSTTKYSSIKKRLITRRKPSSGFDYIRKKKKSRPTSTPFSAKLAARTLKKKEDIEKNGIEKRTELDIQREIQRWVLNKSVGQTTLHKAARLGYIDVVAYCLEKLRLNPNVKDNAGYTPLHEACTQGYLDVALCLLMYGADLSVSAHSGIRPIHEASESCSIDVLRLLLSYGADPQITTYNGKTAYMLAGNDEAETFIEEFYKDIQCSTKKVPWTFDGPWKNLDYDISLQPDSDNELEAEDHCQLMDTFEFEESDNLLPPLYKLKNLPSNCTWVLLNDLSTILCMKSKEKILKYIYPKFSPIVIQKELILELKISEFLENAVCIQLLNAGEKINIRSSKITMVKYNESLQNILKVDKCIMKL